MKANYELTIDDQIVRALKIFDGAKMDDDGYCACPKCGSRNLLNDGHSVDDGYITCLACGFGINHEGDQYLLLSRWNRLDRSCFQLSFYFCA